VPLKNASGLTSTAAVVTGGVRRLTLREVAALPDVFDVSTCGLPDAEALLVNTGLLLIRMRAVDPVSLHFTVQDAVRYSVSGFGFVVWPEDWALSLGAKCAGLRVFATRTPRVEHIGTAGFSTAVEPWGIDADPNRGEVLR
jgi:hypothetical protein